MTVDETPEIAPVRRSLLAAATLLIFVIYLLTGTYTERYGVDAFTNAAQARAFADDQDPILEEVEGLATSEFQGHIAWFTTAADGGTTSKYPPGTAVWAAPFYLVDHSLVEVVSATSEDTVITHGYPNTVAPATVAAALSVTLAMLFFGMTMSGLLPERAVLSSMGISALGTSAWSVAADVLWQHGPAMMCVSAGTFLTSRDRPLLAGLAFGAGALVRPHTAVIAACIGLTLAISRRSIREVGLIGIGTAVGLGLLLAYNDAVFGSPSVSGGYAVGFSDRLSSAPLSLLLERLWQSLVHGRVGMLWTSPFLAVSFLAVLRKPKCAPDWATGAALGGFLYLVVQYRANRVTGGYGFFSYRYPLEALMAAGPMLTFATWSWIRERELIGRLFALTAAVAVAMHAIGAVLS